MYTDKDAILVPSRLANVHTFRTDAPVAPMRTGTGSPPHWLRQFEPVQVVAQKNDARLQVRGYFLVRCPHSPCVNDGTCLA